jgi:beta-1,4-N-acetylglucosaminyltransferase
LLRVLKSKGYTKLVVQKGNGAYIPQHVLPKGQTNGSTEGVEVE